MIDPATCTIKRFTILHIGPHPRAAPGWRAYSLPGALCLPRIPEANRTFATFDPVEVELAYDWRSKSPARFDIGPVLDRDDVVAGKVLAL